MKNKVLLLALIIGFLSFNDQEHITVTNNIQSISSIIQSQDNRDPQEINSSAESRKRRRQDELQRIIQFNA